MGSETPISVSIACADCGVVAHHEAPGAFVDPRPSEVDPTWDGIFLLRVIECHGCGAIDRYQVVADDVSALRLRARESSGSVLLRRVNVLDGERARRPTEALNSIRARLDANPEDATMWRHLGNTWNLFGDLDAAAEAWGRAVAVGKDEFPAALSLALLAAGRGDSEHATTLLVQALSRIGGLKAPEVPGSPSTDELAELLLVLLDSYANAFPETTLMVAWAPPAARLAKAKSIVVTMSGIYLIGLECWDRLGEFLASGAPITAALQDRAPDEISDLQRFLDSDHSFDELFVVRQPPSPPRWISSSKKRKRAGRS